MLYRYSEFITEGLKDSGFLYWNNNDFKKALERDWTEVTVKKYKGKVPYQVGFKIGPNTYDYGSVLLDVNGSTENYLLEDESTMTKQFTEKFNDEFWKNPTEYIKDMAYIPKCLGDVSHVRDAGKYNL